MVKELELSDLDGDSESVDVLISIHSDDIMDDLKNLFENKMADRGWSDAAIDTLLESWGDEFDGFFDIKFTIEYNENGVQEVCPPHSY